jgi:CTD small phosphatase-like protein 2
MRRGKVTTPATRPGMQAATAAAAAANAQAAAGRPAMGSPAAVSSQARTSGALAPARGSVSGAATGTGAALFSPKFEDGHHAGPAPAAAGGAGASAGAAAVASGTGAAAGAKGAAADATGAAREAAATAESIIDDVRPLERRLPANAVIQKGPIHTYCPPSMNAVFRALQHKNALGQIKIANLRKDMGDDTFPEEEEYDPFIFIKNLAPLISVVPTPRKSPIPRKSANAPPITLALDLDETLVHCSIQPIDSPEFTFHVNFNGVDYEVYVRIRPHLEYFLKQVAQWFEVVVFTASQKVYADSLLNIIDPRNEYISHRVFRDSCVCVEGNYLKDLNILGRPLDKVVIVDNSFQAFGFQLDNGIPCESWFDDEHDCELLNLIPFLRHLKDVSDVRPHVRNAFRLQEFVDSLVPPAMNLGGMPSAMN